MYGRNSMVRAFSLLFVIVSIIVIEVLGFVNDKTAVRFKKSDKRYVNGLLDCACSPSGRGTDDTAAMYVEQGLSQVDSLLTGSGNIAEKMSTAAARVSNALEQCTEQAGYEACINAAANMRARFSEMPLCKHDSRTGKNVRTTEPDVEDDTVVTVGSCSTDKQYVSSSLGGVIAITGSGTKSSPGTNSKAPAPSKTPKPSATPSKKAAANNEVPPSKKRAQSKKPELSPFKKAKAFPTASKSPSSLPIPIASSTSSALPSPSQKYSRKPCIESSWLDERGLMGAAIKHAGIAEVLCVPGLPCGTPGHLLRAENGELRTYREVCASRTDCSSSSVEVSQLSHTINWSVYVANGLALTSLSAHPQSTSDSPTRRLAMLADRINQAGFGHICNAIALVPHYLDSLERYMKMIGIGEFSDRLRHLAD